MADLLHSSRFSDRFTHDSSAPRARGDGGNQRVHLQVAYLTSFAHSASNSLLHVFQCAEPHRVAIGVAARRVVILADEKSYECDFEATLRRCAAVNSIIEMSVLPRDGDGLLPTGQPAPLNDADVLLQQSSQLDFIRTIGALFRPIMSGGTPPIFELDEGQPLAARVNCHRRRNALRSAVVDGISREALRALTEDHSRQLRAMQQSLSVSKHHFTAETVDFYSERDRLLETIEHLKSELHQAQRLVREERDAAKLQLSRAQDDVRHIRDELTMQKLLRFQPMSNSPPRQPQSYVAQPSDQSYAALNRLHEDIASNEQFIARVRARGRELPQEYVSREQRGHSPNAFVL
jgi:hypothetical protein